MIKWLQCLRYSSTQWHSFENWQSCNIYQTTVCTSPNNNYICNIIFVWNHMTHNFWILIPLCCYLKTSACSINYSFNKATIKDRNLVLFERSRVCYSWRYYCTWAMLLCAVYNTCYMKVFVFRYVWKSSICFCICKFS